MSDKEKLEITCDVCAAKNLGRILMKYKGTYGPFKTGRSYDTYVCPNCGKTRIANYLNGEYMGPG